MRYFCSNRNYCFVLVLQTVLIENNQNAVISPFSVKLILAIFAEAAGHGSSTNQEILTILSGIKTENDLRELYARPFVSLLVRRK